MTVTQELKLQIDQLKKENDRLDEELKKKTAKLAQLEEDIKKEKVARPTIPSPKRIDIFWSYGAQKGLAKIYENRALHNLKDYVAPDIDLAPVYMRFYDSNNNG